MVARLAFHVLRRKKLDVFDGRLLRNDDNGIGTVHQVRRPAVYIGGTLLLPAELDTIDQVAAQRYRKNDEIRL